MVIFFAALMLSSAMDVVENLDVSPHYSDVPIDRSNDHFFLDGLNGDRPGYTGLPFIHRNV